MMQKTLFGLVAGWLFLFMTGVATAQIGDAPLAELLTSLAGSDDDAKRDATYELVRRGDYSPAVIVGLETVLQDDDTQVRFQALMGLARAGNASAPAIAGLVKCLGDGSDQIRFRAADALGKIGNASIKPLVNAWDGASNKTKGAICLALESLGPGAVEAVPLIEAAIESEDDELPKLAARALVAILPQTETATLKLVASENAAVREVGIMAVSNLTNPSIEAVGKLQAAASDSEPAIREIAILAISKSSLAVDDKADLIERALIDVNASVRAAAIVAVRKANLVNGIFANRIAAKLPEVDDSGAESLIKTLGSMGAVASETVPQVLNALDRKEIDRSQLAMTLSSFGETAVPKLLAALDDHADSVPVLSEALARIGQPAIASLLAGMSSDSELIRNAATQSLGKIQPAQEAITKALVVAIQDRSPIVREAAVMAVITSDQRSDDARTALRAAMQDPVASVRSRAIGSLATFGYESAQFDEAINTALVDDEAEVRGSALAVLQTVSGGLDAYVDTIVSAIQDSSTEVRLKAAETLGMLPRDGVKDNVINAFVVALTDPDQGIRIAATESITKLQQRDERILDQLGKNLGGDVALIRATLGAISEFKEAAVGMVPEVVSLLDHEAANVRVDVLNTLTAIDKDAESLSQTLISGLDDSDWEVRRAAGIGLGKLGKGAIKAVPVLFSKLSDEEDSDYANGALREINAAPVEAIPMLTENLDSADRRIGYFAIMLLGKIGPAASEALPKLQSMLEDVGGSEPRSDFRKTILREAIEGISGEPVK